MRSTARPVLASPSSMRSVRGGGPPGGKGAGSQRTRPVTSYVPLTHTVRAGLQVCHVPPPVVEPFDPSPPPGATNVPDPVSVIREPSFARAAACPPGRVVNGDAGGKLRLIMSQRTCWAAPRTIGDGMVIAANATNAT